MKGEVIELEATGVVFYSQHDEECFFAWLRKLASVKKFEGRGRTLYISVDAANVDEMELREFLALFNRFGVEMRQLAKLERIEFSEWFRSKEAYWYERIFG